MWIVKWRWSVLWCGIYLLSSTLKWKVFSTHKHNFYILISMFALDKYEQNGQEFRPPARRSVPEEAFLWAPCVVLSIWKHFIVSALHKHLALGGGKLEPSLNCCLVFFHLRCILSIMIKQLNDERIFEPIISLQVGNGIVIIQSKQCYHHSWWRDAVYERKYT